MKKNLSNELSYYRLSLLSFLKESHPELSNDSVFIESRADLAADAHSQAVKEGLSQSEAEETANAILFQNLHFSKQDVLVNILWNEFSEFVPEGQAKDFAIKILPECNEIFTHYPLSDNFAESVEYDKLYTELVGFISIWIEENEL